MITSQLYKGIKSNNTRFIILKEVRNAISKLPKIKDVLYFFEYIHSEKIKNKKKLESHNLFITITRYTQEIKAPIFKR